MRLTEAPVAESESVEPNLVIDRDAEGRIFGIEVLWLSSMEGANPMAMAFEIARREPEGTLAAQ